MKALVFERRLRGPSCPGVDTSLFRKAHKILKKFFDASSCRVSTFRCPILLAYSLCFTHIWCRNYRLYASLFRKELMRTRQGETIDWGHGFALPRLPSRPQEGSWEECGLVSLPFLSEKIWRLPDS